MNRGRALLGVMVGLAGALLISGSTLSSAEEEQDMTAPTAPILVRICKPNPPTYNRFGAIVNRPSLTVEFVDNRPVAATEVVFGLVARGALVARTKDVGTFSPGVAITHTYGISGQVFPLRTSFPRCTVLRAKFSDGIVWNNPHPPQP